MSLFVPARLSTILRAASGEGLSQAAGLDSARSSDGKAMSGPPAAARRSVVKRRITLAVLTLVNSSNFWQRNLLYALARFRRVFEGGPLFPL